MALTVHIPEYLEDCELTAGEDLAREPAFWLAHLLLTVGDPSEDPERYGVNASAYEAMVEHLSNSEEPWPVLRVPFEGGHTAYAVYANFDDANNVDFFVRHHEWGRLGYLGQWGADEAGPGLSWTELTTLAETAQNSGEGLTDSSQRLLLLLPMLGDAETPPEARHLVAQALTRCGISPDAAEELATVLVGKQEARSEPSWTVTADSPIAVCSTPYSPRHIPLALGITPRQARALADALTGRG
ncbi:hypothetical protein SAMN05216489_05918 [Streptomyces sp. 3213]|uniref:hypothetical protein n=1 Tax=Streptomyces sp. 3213.3 TaxID=1855348 RepID=UPI00089D0198|nr:hypothetical protein [Streptomyces sp. 3213.3]SEE22894.1 hypothetical protein SAMN05216489_05918 [Streptomyces sp. 3213] [Streptomyces sp. 3213.3]